MSVQVKKLSVTCYSRVHDVYQLSDGQLDVIQTTILCLQRNLLIANMSHDTWSDITYLIHGIVLGVTNFDWQIKTGTVGAVLDGYNLEAGTRITWKQESGLQTGTFLFLGSLDNRIQQDQQLEGAPKNWACALDDGVCTWMIGLTREDRVGSSGSFLCHASSPPSTLASCAYTTDST